MTISFTGLGSGMDYSSWINALVAEKQEGLKTIQTKIKTFTSSQTTLNNLKSSFNSLNSCISTFTDSNMLSAFDIFSRKKADVSDDNKTVLANVNNDATIQNFDLEVLQIATPTVATGINNLGKLATKESKLMDLNNKVIDKGNISLYVNNQKYSFEVTEESTLQDFCNFLEESTGGSAQLNDNGTLTLDLSSANVSDIKLGSNSDSGNLLDFFGFKTKTDENGNIVELTSSKTLTGIDTNGAITGNGNLAGSVTEGTFKIGNVEFTIDDKTSISGLIYQINSNSDTGVTASYDALSNKLVLKSKNPGSTTINIEAGTSNFTDIVGWTNSGNITPDSQILGKNSKFTINGDEFEAASNTVGEDVTGIKGLTLTLNKITKEGEPITINIANDLSEVENNIETFIKKYNQLVTDLKNASSKDGTMAYDSTLRKMISEMSNTLMNTVPGLSTYRSFSTIGISTGKASTDVTNVPTTLTFDKAKFEEAMANNPDEVKKLFINEDKENASNNGVMTKLESMINGYLDIEKGYFTTKNNSFETQIDNLNKSLTRKQSSIEAYRTRLEKQFQSMDNYIAKMQSYSSYLSNI